MMAPHLLTAAAAPAIDQIAREDDWGVFSAAPLFDQPPAPGRSLVIGDPVARALCRIEHSQIVPEHLEEMLAFMPPALAALLRASNGWGTCITHLYKCSISDPAKTAALLTFLASALRAIIARTPAGPVRDTLMARPVYARLDAALVLQFKAAFPLAGADGMHIWRNRLDAARDDVAAFAVDV